MSFFHFTMVRLAAGSVIEPGNWGRLLNRYENAPVNGSQFGTPWILTRELLFEMERMRGFPDKPSRLSSTFSFIDRAAAEVYRGENDRPRTQVLHEVELVDPTLALHVGVIAQTAWPPPGHSFLEIATPRAKAYWRGEGDGIREMVSASGLRIVKCLD